MLTSKYKNFCFGNIGAGGITSSQGLDTTFVVAPDATSGVLPATGEYILVVFTSTCAAPHVCANREGIKIKSRSSNTLTIKARNVIAEGNQQVWAVGDKYVLAMAAEAIDEIEAGILNAMIELRNITQETVRNPIVSILDSVDENWTQEVATFAWDASDYVSGYRSGKLTTTNGSGPYNAVATKTFSPAKLLTGSHVSLDIKRSSTITGITLFFLCPDWSNYASLGFSLGYIPHSAWTTLTCPIDAMTKVGSPNYANVTTIRLEALSSVNTATLNFDNVKGCPNLLNKGAIIITFDDGNDSDFIHAKKKMDEYGFKGVSFINPPLIGGSGKLTLDQLTKMHSTGWDISAHTWTHPSLTSLTSEQVQEEIIKTKRYLIDNGFASGARFFAYPYSDVNSSVHTIVSKYHLITRLVTPFSTNKMSSFPMFSPYTIEGVDSANTTPANMLTWIQNVKANKGLGVMLFHKLVAAAPTQYEHLIADFNTFIDNIAAQGVPVITLSDLVDRYLRLEPYDPTPYNWLNLG